MNNDLPSLAPDRDQVEAYRNTRTATDAKTGKTSRKQVADDTPQVQPARSGWISFFILILFAGGGAGSWWIYQQDQKTQAYLLASDRRIQELERLLSATGEEMGESAGAMKARLEALTTKTDDLWKQMDKLWASAWRRNQADITKLNSLGKIHSDKISRFEKQNTTNNTSLKNTNQKLTDMEFNVGILAEQVQTAQKLNTELEQLKNSIATLQSKTMGGDKQQIELAGKVSQLLTTQNILLKRLRLLESKVGKPASGSTQL